MAKIMLVEDDNNLREIYEARLLAEGYDIVSAKDGEDALALAVKEKPDLIISDVMMPKISGFDMLDILRSTPETKNTKVIMMTALSQAEDKGRADSLGADRYLVKSQVTLEDVAKVAQEVLNGEAATPVGAAAAPAPEPVSAPVPDTATTQQPTPVAPEPVAAAPVADEPVVPPTMAAPAAPTEPTPPASTAPSEPAVQAPEPPTPVAEEPVVTEPSMPAVEPVAAAPEQTPQQLSQPISIAVTEEAPAPAEVVDTVPAPASQQPETPPMPEISNELTQTTEEEANAAETQINEILAQTGASTDPDPSAPTAPAEVASPEAPVGETPETIEVAAPPAETEVDGVKPPVFSAPAEAEVAPEAAPTIAEPAPVAPAAPEPVNQTQLADNTDSAVTGGKRIIQPINDMSNKPNLDELLKKEESLGGTAAPMAEQVVIPGATTPPVAGNDKLGTDTPSTPPPTGSVISPNDIAL